MDEQLVGKLRAAKMLGVAPKTLEKIAKAGLLSRQQFPGSHPRFKRAEVEALAKTFTVSANREANATAAASGV